MADFENNKQNETTDNSKDQLKQNLDHIQNEINQLTSNTDSSDDKIEGVDGMLTTAFADYLRKQDVKLVYALYKQVNDIIAKNKDNNDPNLQKLKNFLTPLADSAKMEGNMDSKLSDEEAKEYKGKVGRIENLQETKSNLISSLEEKIKKLDGADDNLKKTLSNIKAVVEQPNTVNVKSLQKFILKNLSGEDREKFFNYNFKAGPDGKKSSDNPDGLFGQNLVDGINTFLQGLDGYIAQVESSKNIQSENDEIAKKQAEQKKQEEARKLAEQKEKERVNSLNMSKIIDNEDGKVIKSLSSSIKNHIDDIIEIENSDDNDKSEKLGEKLAKLDSKLKKEYMDLFVDKVKAKEKGKPVEEYEKQLNVILKFGSWKIRPEDGAIIDDTDNISDYRKYANKIGGNVILTEEKHKVPVGKNEKGGKNNDKGNLDENGYNVTKNTSSIGVGVIDYNIAKLFGYKETTIDQSMRDKLKIPNNVAVYTKDGDENAYHYRLGSDIIRVSIDESSDNRSEIGGLKMIVDENNGEGKYIGEGWEYSGKFDGENFEPSKFEYDGISIDIVGEYLIKSGKGDGDETIYFTDPDTADTKKDIATLMAVSKCLKGAKEVTVKEYNILSVTKQDGKTEEFNIKDNGLVDSTDDVCKWMNSYIKNHK